MEMPSSQRLSSGQGKSRRENVKGKVWKEEPGNPQQARAAGVMEGDIHEAGLRSHLLKTSSKAQKVTRFELATVTRWQKKLYLPNINQVILKKLFQILVQETHSDFSEERVSEPVEMFLGAKMRKNTGRCQYQWAHFYNKGKYGFSGGQKSWQWNKNLNLEMSKIKVVKWHILKLGCMSRYKVKRKSLF